MGVENGTYISDFNPLWPLSDDYEDEGDNHLRLIKLWIQDTFPNITGAMTVTHTELNYSKVHSASGTAADLTLTGTPVAPTPAAGTANTQVATAEFVVNVAMSTSLPGQSASTEGQGIVSRSSAANWGQTNSEALALCALGIR